MSHCCHTGCHMDPTYIWVAKGVQGEIGENSFRSKYLHNVYMYMYKYIYISYALSETPKDCQWNQFGPWSSCSKPCGGGAKWRKRTKMVNAEKGGKPCQGGKLEMVSCNNEACAGKCDTSEKL